MDKIDTSNFQGYLVGQVIAASVGVLLLAVGDFGGFYYRDYYTHVETNGYIYLGSGFLSTILILLGIGGLLIALRAAIKSLQAKDASPTLLRENAQRAVKGAGFTAALATLGALVLALNSTLEGIEWWLDSGFYGAFAGGLLTVFFGRLMLNKIEG